MLCSHSQPFGSRPISLMIINVNGNLQNEAKKNISTYSVLTEEVEARLPCADPIFKFYITALVLTQIFEFYIALGCKLQFADVPKRNSLELCLVLQFPSCVCWHSCNWNFRVRVPFVPGSERTNHYAISPYKFPGVRVITSANPISGTGVIRSCKEFCHFLLFLLGFDVNERGVWS